MSKKSSAIYYQDKKERLQKETSRKISKLFLRRKGNSGNIFVKNLSEDEKQKLAKYRKEIIKWEKTSYYNCK